MTVLKARTDMRASDTDWRRIRKILFGPMPIEARIWTLFFVIAAMAAWIFWLLPTEARIWFLGAVIGFGILGGLIAMTVSGKRADMGASDTGRRRNLWPIPLEAKIWVLGVPVGGVAAWLLPAEAGTWLLDALPYPALGIVLWSAGKWFLGRLAPSRR